MAATVLNDQSNGQRTSRVSLNALVSLNMIFNIFDVYWTDTSPEAIATFDLVCY